MGELIINKVFSKDCLFPAVGLAILAVGSVVAYKVAGCKNCEFSLPGFLSVKTQN